MVERFDNLRIPVTSSKREKGITPYYGANGIQDYVQGYTHDGEFVLVAEDGANDLQNYPVHYVNGKVWVNNHAHVLQGKNKMVDNLFLVNAIKQIKIETYLVGGSRAKLNADVMMKLPIKVPTFNEQQKIGEYFSKFDTLITLHQRKLDKLKRVKSAYLTEMFPAEGEREPKRRFPGFTVAWEQRKLGEVADVRDGTHDSPRYINEGYPLLTSKNVGNGYINYDDVKYVSENDYVQINKRSKVDINDILMGMIGTIGNLALIREEPDFAIKNVALIKHTSNFDYQFLFQELQTSAISKELLSGMDGGTQKFVSLKKIRNLSVMLPSENEQKQIGAFFKQFDSFIALHQRKPKW